MNILVLGGTRFTGRAVAARLLRAGHQVTVSSRRPAQAPPGVAVLAGERTAVLAGLASRNEFDLVLDFTAYDAAAAEQALAAVPAASYLLISSTWLIRGMPGQVVDEPVPADFRAPPELPEVTRRYLAGKAGAEACVLAARARGRSAAVLRLPILGGANDHTGRLDFYRRRIVDGGPLLLVDGGDNCAHLLWSEDAAEALAQSLAPGKLFSAAIHDGISDAGHPVWEILAMIARAEGLLLRAQSIASEELTARLPAYLEQEPLWRERAVTAGRGNLFALTGVRPHPLEEWLAAVIARQPPGPEKDGMRAQELAALAEEVGA